MDEWTPSDELVQDAYNEVNLEIDTDEESSAKVMWAVFRAVNRAAKRGELVPRSRLEFVGYGTGGFLDENDPETEPDRLYRILPAPEGAESHE